jgi:hypothetical protein
VPLPWVRLDTSFPRNPKLLALLAEKDGHRAALAYICMLAYSGEQGTDGFIPREALPFVHARYADVTRLVTVNLVYPQPGGWLIKSWSEFQESTTESQERSRRAQAAAQARWSGHETATPAERQRNYRKRRSGAVTMLTPAETPGDDARDDAQGAPVTMPNDAIPPGSRQVNGVTMRVALQRDDARHKSTYGRTY